jgi:uncharacterized SAM-binding protein YcdF (DUF218 family)
MKAIVLLAHEMDANGLLSPESAVRADAVARLASKTPEAIVITPGWAYRKDTITPVGQAMKNYLVDKCGLQEGRIFVEGHSRDTVGDAVFSRLQINALGEFDEIVVATSSYHIGRAMAIFEFVFGNGHSLKEEAVEFQVTSELLEHEAESLKAFRRTFKGIDAGDLDSILGRLKSKHPLYQNSKATDQSERNS